MSSALTLFLRLALTFCSSSLESPDELEESEPLLDKSELGELEVSELELVEDVWLSRSTSHGLKKSGAIRN